MTLEGAIEAWCKLRYRLGICQLVVGPTLSRMQWSLHSQGLAEETFRGCKPCHRVQRRYTPVTGLWAKQARPSSSNKTKCQQVLHPPEQLGSTFKEPSCVSGDRWLFTSSPEHGVIQAKRSVCDWVPVKQKCWVPSSSLKGWMKITGTCSFLRGDRGHSCWKNLPSFRGYWWQE